MHATPMINPSVVHAFEAAEIDEDAARVRGGTSRGNGGCASRYSTRRFARPGSTANWSSSQANAPSGRRLDVLTRSVVDAVDGT